MIRYNEKKGIAALATTLLIGAVIVELALAGILAVTFLNNENYGIRLSAQARNAATSALQEALIRVIRYKNLPNGNSPVAWNRSISFTVGGANAMAIICRSVEGSTHNIGTGCNPLGQATGGEYEIISTGTMLGKRFELKSKVAVDPITGKVTLISSQEVPYDQ